MQIDQMKGYWYDKAQVAVYICTDTDTSGNCTGGEANAGPDRGVEAELSGPTLAPFIEQFYFEDHEAGLRALPEAVRGQPGHRVRAARAAQRDVLGEPQGPDPVRRPHREPVGPRGRASVVDQRGYLDPIFTVLNAASYTAIGIAVLMLIAAVLLIATTIRLSASSRRRELGIMRLVGASNRFIQTPFILEGVIAALIGSVLAGGAIFAIVDFFVKGYLEGPAAARRRSSTGAAR